MKQPSVLFRISSVIFRCQKYVKKGYMEMTKKIYLETLKSVLGRSILHYSAKNYCPVSLLSVVSKVFQKLVNDRSVDHLEK